VQGQWYFQRYIQHLPTAGEIVFFDRSWCLNACAWLHRRSPHTDIHAFVAAIHAGTIAPASSASWASATTM